MNTKCVSFGSETASFRPDPAALKAHRLPLIEGSTKYVREGGAKI